MNDPLIEEFISYIGAERGLSPHTQQAYRRDLYQLLAFVQKERRGWPPDLPTIEHHLRARQREGTKASSRARGLMAVRVFLAFLYREGDIDRDVGALLESPRTEQTIPVVLNSRDLDRLMNAPDPTTDEGLRDRALIELLYGTGIRVSELCSLSLCDISESVVRVKGKGGKERIVPLGTKALAALETYLRQVRHKYGSEITQKIFVSNRGRPIDRTFVWRQIKKYATHIGLEKKVSPHTFRHTYASHLLDGGADLRVIQELLGHAHISSTDRYTHVSKAQLREVFRAFHPRWKATQSPQHHQPPVTPSAPQAESSGQDVPQEERPPQHRTSKPRQ